MCPQNFWIFFFDPLLPLCPHLDLIYTALCVKTSLLLYADNVNLASQLPLNTHALSFRFSRNLASIFLLNPVLYNSCNLSNYIRFSMTPSPLRCGHHIWRLPYSFGLTENIEGYYCG